MMTVRTLVPTLDRILTFERVVRLPETIDGGRIQATFDRGVVTILVPKAPAARARKITISPNGHHR